jgi:4,5-dihydroxyphthalate decarboxylase
MAASTNLQVLWEMQGAFPHFRYDHIQPLLQGRVSVDGVDLVRDDPMVNAGFYDNPKYKDGDFGILDLNWGDSIPAIANGWDITLVPVFLKRKPSYNYLWVRADRGIETPKDLEGKTIATVGYGSAITTFNRGFLQDFFGVDLSKLSWLSAGPGRFEIHDKNARVEYATGPRKSPVQRLLDGEVDGCTGDITESSAWAALESNPDVKPLFPNVQDLNRKLSIEHGIVTPVHMMTMGGRLNREHADLARRLYDAFEKSREIAYDDALGDGSGFSLTVHNREVFRDQMHEWGDVWKHGILANKNTIDRFLEYNFKQGLTKTKLSVEQVFAKSTLDT